MKKIIFLLAVIFLLFGGLAEVKGDVAYTQILPIVVGGSYDSASIEHGKRLQKRIGYGLSEQCGSGCQNQINDFSIDFGGWFINWNFVKGSSENYQIDFSPLVGSPNKHGETIPKIENLNSHLSDLPNGTTVYIGNEVGFSWEETESADSEIYVLAQKNEGVILGDPRTPREYAQDYHDYYHELKSLNQTFLVGTGAMITHGKPHGGLSGIEYLSQTMDEYFLIYGERMPVDVYNIHPYVLDGTGTDFVAFRNMVIEFKHFLNGIGESSKPLDITEIGVLYLDTPVEDVSEFMLSVFEWSLSENYVQKISWFVLNSGAGRHEGKWVNTSLFSTETKEINYLGEVYREYYLNLVPN